jgi:hypothetical protein
VVGGHGPVVMANGWWSVIGGLVGSENGERLEALRKAIVSHITSQYKHSI